jgi:hypothetical protein
MVVKISVSCSWRADISCCRSGCGESISVWPHMADVRFCAAAMIVESGESCGRW